MAYSLKSISKTCAATGEPLEPGSTCISVLVDQHGEQQRLDYSWAARDQIPDNIIARWQTQIPEAEPQSQSVLDPEFLLEMFQNMAEAPNESQEQLCYVIALLLVRKKRLIIEESINDDDSRKLSLVGSKGEGPFVLREPELTHEEIQQIEIQLQSLQNLQVHQQEDLEASENPLEFA